MRRPARYQQCDAASIAQEQQLDVSPAKSERRCRGAATSSRSAAPRSACSDGAILRRFVELAGGREARVAVIPTASRRSDAGQDYETLFRAMGVAAVAVLRIDQRADAEDPATLAAIGEATGVFLTGGDQLRLSTTLGGTSRGAAAAAAQRRGRARSPAPRPAPRSCPST